MYNSFKVKQNKGKKTPNNITEINQFNLRDKFDMITQNYIELLDEKKLLEKLNLDLKNEIERLKKLLLIKDISPNESKIDLEKSIEIIQTIKELIQKGPVIIKKDIDKVIIKSYNQKEDDRYEFSEKEWSTF